MFASTLSQPSQMLDWIPLALLTRHMEYLTRAGIRSFLEQSS